MESPNCAQKFCSSPAKAGHKSFSLVCLRAIAPETFLSWPGERPETLVGGVYGGVGACSLASRSYRKKLQVGKRRVSDGKRL